MSYTLKVLLHCYLCYYSYFWPCFLWHPMLAAAIWNLFPDLKPMKHRKSFHDFHLDHRVNNSTFQSFPAHHWFKHFWQTVQLFCAFVPFSSLNCFWFLLFLVVFSVAPSVLDLSLSLYPSLSINSPVQLSKSPGHIVLGFFFVFAFKFIYFIKGKCIITLLTICMMLDITAHFHL